MMSVLKGERLPEWLIPKVKAPLRLCEVCYLDIPDERIGRITCSEECDKVRKKEYQRMYSAKRYEAERKENER